MGDIFVNFAGKKRFKGKPGLPAGRRKGRGIEDADILIGASAIANNAVLVTDNEKHLGHIEGLRIENWTN